MINILKHVEPSLSVAALNNLMAEEFWSGFWLAFRKLPTDIIADPEELNTEPHT